MVNPQQQQDVSLLSSSFIIIVHRITRIILLASEEATQILGYNSSDLLVGKHSNDLKYHDVLFQIHHDPIEPFDYWCLQLKNQKQQRQQQYHEKNVNILKLSPYGIIQHTYPTTPQEQQYTGQPIMRRIHPDDVETFCRGLNQLYKRRRRQQEQQLYTNIQQHQYQITIPIRWRYYHNDNNINNNFINFINEDDGDDDENDKYQSVLFTVTLAAKDDDRSIVDNYSHGHYRTIEVNNEILVHHHTKDKTTKQLEDLLRIRCLTAMADFRSYTDSNIVVQKGLKWMEGTGFIKNKEGLMDSAQMTMEKVLDQLFT
ncbi:hypothetical protein INT45_007497 [Circinella minor]|uniref:PAS domain-containing protein n=1 Tax=Circinella minor TaxID=1195481 RepID=A0A8H7SG42_9FUNG|nr:hypothetical protein INT45_007497 [Circinella minor]